MSIGHRYTPIALVAALLGFVAIGIAGAYRYLDNYWIYRGFAPPRDPTYVQTRGTTERLYVASAALGGRRQPVDVYLPPGYAAHPARSYPVLYLLHGVPGRPAAFLDTVRMGVVEDELVARRKARALILVMPFGSTGSFTDEEWANGVRPHEGWETFVARDLVRAIDARYRTIRSAAGRALGGLSEGGYGSLNIGLHHPGEFRVLESWSGYERADPVRAVFGSGDPSALRRNSPLLTLPRHATELRRDRVRFWFYTGTGDPLRRQNAEFAAELRRLRLPFTYYVVRGGHNWALWRGNAARAYLAASRGLRGP
ncbi:MAG TPA: alpha/beta hydrolase-fold protein [Gaiellaceae bacterium]|nr:alpha/beta hydrolase-fold protein [Gaiellaceae bacterium]